MERVGKEMLPAAPFRWPSPPGAPGALLPEPAPRWLPGQADNHSLHKRTQKTGV